MSNVRITYSLKDWSLKNPQVRHALFCVAYKVFQGIPRHKAARDVADRLGFTRDAMRKLAVRYIRQSLETPHE